MLKAVWELLKETLLEWHRDDASQLAAALAFYAVLSFAPTVVFVVAIAGLVFGKEAVQGEIVERTQDWIGADTAEFIQAVIVSASELSTGIIAMIISVATMLFGATRFFVQLQTALNRIWRVRLKPRTGMKGFLKNQLYIGFIRNRLLSFLMVLGVGFLVLTFLLVGAMLTVISRFLSDLLPIPAYVRIANFIISFGVTTILFAAIYTVLPDVKIAWRDVWIGSAVTSLLFTIGRFLIAWYIGISSIGSAYGAAASLFVLLIWVYYSAQVFLLGAEFTEVYTERYGSSIVPDQHAVRITRNISSEREDEH